jgi:hypothetical protein
VPLPVEVDAPETAPDVLLARDDAAVLFVGMSAEFCLY